MKEDKSMVSIHTVDDQLRRTGHKIGLWGRSEVRELCNILLPGEHINDCVHGHYVNGFAMICATNQRIILVDVKPMFLTVEDIRYDMISEIDYSHGLLNATVKVFTPTKSLEFTSWNITRLRRLTTNSQQHVFAIRQYQNANVQPFTQNYNMGQMPGYSSTTMPNIAASQFANPQYVTPQITQTSTNYPDEDISLASIAIDHTLPSTPIPIANSLNPANALNPANSSYYPINPYVKSSFKAQNRLWPKKGIFSKR